VAFYNINLIINGSAAVAIQTTNYFKNMKYILILALALVPYTFSYGQTVTELYSKKNYEELVKFENKFEKLTAAELYMVGFAFFQSENDIKAVEFYDKAISKGLNNGTVYFYKGLSLRYLKRYDESLIEIEKSLKFEPTNQEFMNEKGMVFYVQLKYEKALEVFEAAKKLPNMFPEPYYWIARIYHEKENFDKALAAYNEAEKNLPKESSYYLTTLLAIGQLEYNQTKNYLQSARAYKTAIGIDKENYEIYYKLMKSYNSGKEFKSADSIFALVKTAFENKKLPKDEMEIKTVSIAQFEWNGQIASISKSLVDTKETLDIAYKIFLLNKQGDKVERRFLVEKATQIGKDGIKYLLCEQDKKTGGHITYPYSWTVDNINSGDLEKAVKLVLDGKMMQAASSNFKN
jgi:tetratricopeptide (TPR) repeat protein